MNRERSRTEAKRAILPRDRGVERDRLGDEPTPRVAVVVEVRPQVSGALGVGATFRDAYHADERARQMRAATEPAVADPVDVAERIARLSELSPHYRDVIRRRHATLARVNAQDPGAGALDG